jgi:glycosyltransferase involved in cell wall biosynthesis
MRILYIASNPPLPANNGARMRICAILRALRAEGHSTILAAFTDPGESGGGPDALKALSDEAFVIPRVTPAMTSMGGYLGRLGALLTTSPYAVIRFRSAPLQARIAEQLGLGGVDAVLCDSIYGMVNLPATTLPIILDCPNVEHLILERFADLERSGAKRFYARLEARKLKTFETACCRRAALALACSERDRSVLQALCPGVPIHVAPNTVDLTRYDAGKAPHPGEAPIVLYMGGMDWYPNRDAVDFFVGQVWPTVRSRTPNARLVVAGRNPTSELRRNLEADARIEVMGNVPDMRPVISRSAVVVVPLRIGSGTRLKILEAAAMRKAIVSTSLGVEGLDFVHGKEVVVADDPREFAQDVTELLEDATRRAALGLAGRRRVEQTYSEATMREALRGALASLERQTSR